MAYGFQGFSYPLENANCSAWENGYEAMYRDFKQMKRDFGATIIRMYYPICTSPSVFEHALKAAATNNMAIIFQVWTNFGNGVSEHTDSCYLSILPQNVLLMTSAGGVA